MAVRRRVGKRWQGGKSGRQLSANRSRRISRANMVRAISSPDQAAPADILALQRTLGNRAVTTVIQAFKAEAPDQERSMSGGNFERRLYGSRGMGKPLSKGTRAFMEPRFGADFSDVRLHSGPDALQLNRELGSQAFTYNQDIFLGTEAPQAESRVDRRLLAHELTHVVQQSGAAVKPRYGGRKSRLIRGKLPAGRISRKTRRKYLDFVRMKRKKIKWGKILLPKSWQSKNKPDDDTGTYGHWWTEIGELKDNEWKPGESFGWWPKEGPNYGQTLTGVEGILNQGATDDPHHGETDAAIEFHPVTQVKDSESYEDVRERVLNDIRTFATGYKKNWSWFLGLGNNCHTFQKKMMKKAGLKKKKAKQWLRRPESAPRIKDIVKTSQLAEDSNLGAKATDLLEKGNDLETVAKEVPDFFKKISELPNHMLVATQNLMNISEAELKNQLIKIGGYFAEEVTKYPNVIEKRPMKAGTKLLGSADLRGKLEDITVPADSNVKIKVFNMYTMTVGRCTVTIGGKDYFVPVRTLFGDR